MKNVTSFSALLNVLNTAPDIIILTETWLTELDRDYANIYGYTATHTIRNTGRSGGVSIYVRNCYDVDVLSGLCICSETIESCAVEVNIGGQNISIVGIYRPHNDTIDNFSNVMNMLLEDPILNNKKICLAGDFNVNLLNSDSHDVISFVNNMQSSHCLPIITKPTRFPSGNNIGEPSLLDHMWLNNIEVYTSGIILYDLTDHCPVFVCFNHGVVDDRHKFVKVKFRVQSNKCHDDFIDELGRINWDFSDFNDINDKTAYFLDKINSLYCKCFPLRSKNISLKRLEKSWLTPAIIRSIKTKSNYFKLFRMGIISREVNNRYKNCLNSIIRRAKNTYYNNVFVNCKNNVRKSWDVLKKLMCKTNDRKSIKSIIINNNVINCEHDISNAFHDYFSTVATKLEEDMPPGDGLPPQITPVPQSMFLFPATADECNKVISNLKTSNAGSNNMSVPILKNVKHILASPIAYLINDSFQSGIFPDSLKIACITPIFKQGDCSLLSNYRPISVLPILSKIFEKCIANRLTKWMSKHAIISPKQFGFQKGKSTIDALSSLTDYIYNSINSKHHLISIFIDLRKAFDTVQHSLLLDKLYLMGVRGLSLSLIRSYLRDRRQCVRVGTTISDYKTINIGVPQGSILGPILFLIYVNDLPNVSQLLSTVLFADDTSLSLSAPQFDNLIAMVTGELEKMRMYMLRNRLSLNLDKTFAVVFSNRHFDVNNLNNLKIGDCNLNVLNECKYLGLTIDSKLRFNSHINNIASKVSKTVGIMYKLKHSVPDYVLLNMYYCMIYPYFIYANLIWGGTHDTYLKDLFLLQKKIVRIITNSEFLAHTGPLFAKLEMLKVSDIHRYLISIHAFKSLDSYSIHQHSYFTRNRNNLVPTFQRISLTQNSLSYKLPSYWNNLPSHVKNCSSLSSFKKGLKLHLIRDYNR